MSLLASIGRADRGRSSLVSTLFRRANEIRRSLGEIFYGLTGFEFEREAARHRGDLENLFVFVLFGDLIGAPIMPPYYSLQLLPYVAGDVPTWKRRVLRERMPFEGEEYDLHGV